MPKVATTRVMIILLLASGSALCQQEDKSANALPDLPSPGSLVVNTPTPAETFQTALRDARLPVTAQQGVMHPILQFTDSSNTKKQADFFTRHLSASPSGDSLSHRASANDGFLGRASHAASSLVIAHDDAGRNRLNTDYFLRVLASSAAHSASRPYWKRSASQPFGDFGSTIGSDAGMNVFQEFKPGILQVVKSHEPSFVSHIERSIGHR